MNSNDNLSLSNIMNENSVVYHSESAKFQGPLGKSEKVPASTVEWKADCYSGETPCPSKGSDLLWGCCKFYNAVCCPDRRTCCPYGTDCSNGWCLGNRSVMVREMQFQTQGAETL